MKRKAIVVLIVGAMLLAIGAGPSLAAAERLITGTNSDDTLLGTRGNDLIRGLDGKDLLYGRFGNDRLFGGNNDDEIIGGGDRDVLLGGTGRDTLLGGPHTDYINAVDRGEDFVNCGAGVDTADVDPADVVMATCENVQTVTR